MATVRFEPAFPVTFGSAFACADISAECGTDDVILKEFVVAETMRFDCEAIDCKGCQPFEPSCECTPQSPPHRYSLDLRDAFLRDRLWMQAIQPGLTSRPPSARCRTYRPLGM